MFYCKVARMWKAAAILLGLAASLRANAGGVGVSDPPEPPLPGTGTSSGTGSPTPFHYYRVPVARGAHANRDYEFLWSDTYKSKFHVKLDSLSGTEQINDLDRIGQAICDLPGLNPFALPLTDIQLAYNFLAARDSIRDSLYNPVANAPVGFRVAQPSYDDANRAHIDAYIYARAFSAEAAHPEWPAYHGDASDGITDRRNYGVFPSEFQWSAEDSLSGDPALPFNFNAVMIPGPRPWHVASTQSDRWTRPGGTANSNLIHESMHAMNADVNTDYLHLFASAAEVVSGVSTDPPRFDFDYTFGLTPDKFNTGNSYPHWQAFTAYLAFNWRGSDTTKVAYFDDLLRRWSTKAAAERTLIGLARRMSRAECAECNAYPGFADLDSLDRLQRLIHDWRVATYVNAPQLPGGHYGYPAQFGFSPAQQLKAWQNNDGVAENDGVSVPPIITLGAAQRNEEQLFTQRPGTSTISPRPLRLNMFGAEYIVFKADGSLGSTTQNLTVRVRLPGLLKGRSTSGNPCVTREYSGTLYASLVRYSQASDSLFLHPEWATGIETKSAQLDVASGDLVFEATGFGAAVKSAVLVVTLEDGPEGVHTTVSTNPQDPEPSSFESPVPNTYDFEVSCVAGSSIVPVAVTSLPESSPSWSSDGTTLAIEKIQADGHRGIFTVSAAGGGTPSALRAGTPAQFDPSWSPRGGLIAYTQANTQGRRDLWIAAPGGSAQQLTNDAGAIHEPVFSPNGSKLAYLRYVRTYPSPEDTGFVLPSSQTWVSELRVRSIDSGAESTLLTFAGDSAMSNLRWSPDGQRLFLYGTRVEGGGPWRLYQVALANQSGVIRDGLAPSSVGFDVAPGAGAWLVTRLEQLVWKPEFAEGMATACYTDTTTRRHAYQQLSKRDTVTGQITGLPQVTRLLAPDARWSPDGTKIAYTSLENNDPNIYVTSATTNRAPVLSAALQSYYSIPNCAPLELTLSATDADGDAITYQAVDLPAGALLQSGHDIYWPYPVVGDHWLVARALDTAGGVGSRVIHLAVYDGGDCGGGGGGEDPGEIIPMHGLSDRMPGDTHLTGGGSAGLRAASSFLDGAESGQWVEHTARLTAAGSDSLGHVRTRVITRRPGTLRMDRARLLVVDHDPNTVAVAGADGIVVGSKRKPGSISSTPSASASSASGEERLIPAGTVLIVEWPIEDNIDGLVLDCAQGGNAVGGAASGVLIEVPDATTWQSAGHIHPRTGYDALAVSLGGSSRARLTFASDVAVREVTGYVLEDSPTSPPIVTTVECANTSPEEGVSSLAESDSAAVELEHGDGVTMWFDGPPSLPNKRRKLFLQMTASFTPEVLAGSSSRSETVGSPTRFALFPNKPNPFGSGTTIRFEVPRASMVRVEVFDAMGRRVRALLDHRFEPGAHSVAWDGTDNKGRRVGPGVYLCRMTAEGFQNQQRMVLLGR